MTETEKLIERLEAASGPDREIDLAIWRLVDPKAAEVEAEGKIPLPWLHCYTASIDAAMTLIPGLDGVGWRMTDGAGGPTAEIWRVDYDNGARTAWEVSAEPTATPALALCIAALKARQP